jgi:hypothetical protein
MVFTSKFTGYIKIKEIVNWLQLENVIQRIGEGSWRWCSILAANLLPAKHTQTPPTPNINSPFHAKKQVQATYKFNATDQLYAWFTSIKKALHICKIKKEVHKNMLK